MESSKSSIKKRVGIWIRVSTEDQAQGESPLHHEKRARYYAESKEWKVVELYNLSGVSGKSVIDHPEAKRMIEDVRKGHISALIFSKLARLARNTRELLDIADIFRDCDAGLISLQEAIDTTSPAGRLFYTMIAAMAQWEREEIAARVAASVPIRAKLGKPLGGPAPYGYKWEKQELIPDPQEAPIRKLMFELFLEHKRKKTVANILNERGYRTRNKKLFSDTTVDRLLTDPIAKGLRRANYTKSTGDKKHWELKPESEWVYTEVEPIVSEEVWEQCNQFLSTQRASRKKKSRKPAVHLFSGITFCGDCEEKMYVPSNSPKYTCRKCRRKIHTEDLEAIYQEELKEFLLSEKDLQTYLHQSDDLIVEKTEQLELLKQEEKKVQIHSNKLMDLYMEDQLTSHAFGRQNQPLEERLNQLETEIPKIQSEIDFLKIQNISSEEILTEAKDLYARWPKLSQEEKYQIVETITESIIVDEDEITINFNYLPFLLNSGNNSKGACPCGFLGDKVKKCSCTPMQVQRYRNQLSGPLLDRIDMHIEVPPVQVEEISVQKPGESSEKIRERVNKARKLQQQRFASAPFINCNAQMGSRQIETFCPLDQLGKTLLNSAIERLGLSARAYHRIIKIARTIADLAGSEQIDVAHVAEAVQYRRQQFDVG